MLFFVSHLGSCRYKLIALGGYIAWEPVALAETWSRFGFGVVSGLFSFGWVSGGGMHSMSCMPPPASYSSCPRLKKDWSEHALACACFVVLVVIVKHAETAGAVLRHKVDWQSLRGGKVGGRFPGHRVEIRAHDPVRHPELGLRAVSAGAL